MAADLSTVLDFMEDDGGFDTPPMPSEKYPDGHSYRVPSPDAETGLRIVAIMDITLRAQSGHEVTEEEMARLKVPDEREDEFLRSVLSSSVVDQMLADGCKWEHMKRLAMYGYLFFTVGAKAAEGAREQGLLRGKATGPNRAQRRSGNQAKATATPGASRASRKPQPKPRA